MGLLTLLKKKRSPSPPPPRQTPPLEFRIYCHNIRQDTQNLQPNEQPWHKRRQGVSASIFHNSQKHPQLPFIVGLQEVKHNQLHDILFSLGSEWTYFGVGRDDGKTKGEFCPILYKPSEWQLVKGETLWLSTTPEKPSKSWDSACARILTIVELRHKLGNLVKIINTHFDHKSSKARLNSAKMVLKSIDPEENVVVCGDLNSDREGESYNVLSSSFLKDSSIDSPIKQGFETTNTGFTPGEENLIDFIWTNRSFKYHEVLSHDVGQGLFSDHRPVLAVVSV